MANLETYKVKKPIMVSFEGATDKKGESLDGVVSDGLIQLDPKHSATVKWLDKECISKSVTGRFGSKGDREPAKNYGKPKGAGK